MNEEAFAVVFSAIGMPAVVSAFAGVEQAAKKAETAIAAQQRLSSKERIAAARSEFKVRESAVAEEIALHKKAQSNNTSNALREMRARLEAEKSTADGRYKTAADIEKRLATLAKEAAKEHKKLLREQAQAEKDHAEVVSHIRAKVGAVAGAIGGTGSAIGRGIGNVASPVLQYGMMAATLGGSYSVADAVKRSMNAQESAIALSNSAYNPTSEEGKRRIDPSKLTSAANAVAIKTGQDPAKIMAAWQAYIAKSSDVGSLNELISANEKGDTKGVNKSGLMGLAVMARGSGTDLGEMMNAAGAMKSQNDRLTPQQVSAMMQSVIAQGKLGAVEISDLAKYASVATASAGRLTGKGITQEQAQTSLLGLTQVSMKAGSSAADASTGVKNFVGDITNAQKAKKYAQLGIKLRDKGGDMRDLTDIIGDMFTATAGHTEKMGAGGLGVGNEGMKVLEGAKSFYQNFKSDGEAKGLKGKALEEYAGKETAKELKKYTNAKYSDQDVDDDFNAVMEGDQAKFDRAVTEVSLALQKEVTPLIKDFAKHLPEIVSMLSEISKAGGDMVRWLMDHPKMGIGLIIAGSITKELAEAAIGSAVKRGTDKLLDTVSEMMANSIKSSGTTMATSLPMGSVVRSGALTGAGGMSGAAIGASVAAVAIASMVVTKMVVDEWANAKDGVDKAHAKETLLGAGASSDLAQAMTEYKSAAAMPAGPERDKALAEKRQGLATARENALAQAKALDADAAKQREEATSPGGVMDMAVAGIGFATGQGDAVKEAQDHKAQVNFQAAEDKKKQADEIRANIEAMNALRKAIEGASSLTSGGLSSPSSPARNGPIGGKGK